MSYKPKPRITILNVNNHDYSRCLLSRILQEEGFEVREAATGGEALRLVKENFDLVILDINLPDINGFEVCRRIKADPITASIPVLYLSAVYVQSEDKVQALEGGADGYLMKPVASSELIATVRALLRMRQAEEKLETIAREWRTVFDAISEGVCLLNLEGRIWRCNKAMANFLGKPFSEIIGRTYCELVYNRPDPIDGCPFVRMRETCRYETLDFSMWNRWFHITADPVLDEVGALTGAVFVMDDITERKRTEEHIKAALQEKEVLLKEIHHRVKNNLQIISSLLHLQSECIQDPQALEMFKESQTRLKSMALIHEKLYRSKDLARIDFAEYIQSLIVYLFHLYKTSSNAITLKIHVEDVSLGIDTAIPCGLIINELVSNSLKHAFPAGKAYGEQHESGSEIRIELRSDRHGKFTLIVSDNGVGFPKDLDFRDMEFLGLQLVIALTDQLEGTIELDRRGGTTFKITFSELKYKERG